MRRGARLDQGHEGPARVGVGDGRQVLQVLLGVDGPPAGDVGPHQQAGGLGLAEPVAQGPEPGLRLGAEHHRVVDPSRPQAQAAQQVAHHRRGPLVVVLLAFAQHRRRHGLGLGQAALLEAEEGAQAEHPRPAVVVAQRGEDGVGVLEPGVGLGPVAAGERRPGQVLVHPGQPAPVAERRVALLGLAQRLLGGGEVAADHEHHAQVAQRQGQPGLVARGAQRADGGAEVLAGQVDAPELVLEQAEQPAGVAHRHVAHGGRRAPGGLQHGVQVGPGGVDPAQVEPGLGPHEQQPQLRGQRVVGLGRGAHRTVDQGQGRVGEAFGVQVGLPGQGVTGRQA